MKKVKKKNVKDLKKYKLCCSYCKEPLFIFILGKNKKGLGCSKLCPTPVISHTNFNTIIEEFFKIVKKPEEGMPSIQKFVDIFSDAKSNKTGKYKR